MVSVWPAPLHVWGSGSGCACSPGVIMVLPTSLASGTGRAVFSGRPGGRGCQGQAVSAVNNFQWAGCSCTGCACTFSFAGPKDAGQSVSDSYTCAHGYAGSSDAHGYAFSRPHN